MTFKAGKSGNPKGRPKGVPDKRTSLRKLLEPHAEALVNKAVELALSGDAAALRLCLERLIPKIQEEPVNLTFSPENISTIESLPVIAEEIFRGIEQGELSPRQAKSLLDTLDSYKQTIIAAELAEKLSALENRTDKL